MLGSVFASAECLSTWKCHRDALLADKTKVKVDLQDIKNFDGELGRCLAESPTEYLPMVGSVVAQCNDVDDHRADLALTPSLSLSAVTASAAGAGSAETAQIVSQQGRGGQ